MKTSVLKEKFISRAWHLIDLDGIVLGRAATKIASLLMGKHKAFNSSNLDHGDYVVVINAEKVKVTGKKMSDKMYYSHSGFPGGFKSQNLSQLMAKDPRKVIEKAVKGMLPKNKLQQPRLRRMKVYVGQDHPYQDKLSTNTK